MSDAQSRPRGGVVVFVVVLVLLVGLIVMGVAAKLTNTSTPGTGSGIQTSAPGPTPSVSVVVSTRPTVTPVPTETQMPAQASPPPVVMDDIDEATLPEDFNPVVSDEPKPSDAQIWAYEQAYFTPDPVQRELLMKPLATDQYLAEDLSREPAKFEGIEVYVVVAESEIVSVTVGSNRFTAYVITNVFLETVRGGQVVNRFAGPQHSSAWVNTEDGWRVIKNVEEQ